MPAIFYTACRKCGASGAETSWYDSLLRDGKDIPLHHPGESFDLKKFGLTREKAARAGVLHRFEAYACRTCGAVSYARTLALPTELTGSLSAIAYHTGWLRSLHKPQPVVVCAGSNRCPGALREGRSLFEPVAHAAKARLPR